MDEKQQRRIEEIMERVDCPHDFRCYIETVERGGRIGGLTENGYIECLEEKPWECGFSMPFDNAYLCQCRVRLKIADIVAG